MTSMPVNYSAATLPSLLDIASCLGELTTAPQDIDLIPQYLLTLLPLSHATFALVRQVDAERSELVRCISASSDRCALPPESFRAAALNRELRKAGFPDSSSQQPGASHLPTGDSGSANPATAVSPVSAGQRMVLIAYPNGDIGRSTTDFLSTFEGTRNFLARSLAIMFSWTQDHSVLGDPFAALSKREWQILLQLDSNDSEKELADRLKVSPHTLHSLIKGIYKKLQSPSRLVALKRFHHAVRQYRLHKMQLAPQ